MKFPTGMMKALVLEVMDEDIIMLIQAIYGLLQIVSIGLRYFQIPSWVY